MAQTIEGAMKLRAAKLGMPVAAYQAKLEHEKWCSGCKAWHSRSVFRPDSTRSDGLASYCPATHSRSVRRKPLTRNQIRAHRLIQMRVMRGAIPNPNMIPCMDCKHLGSDRRHEYDHYLGYETPETRGAVQAVCASCHRTRERNRRNGQ